MKNLLDSIKNIENEYFETLKYLKRNFEINLIMLENGIFNSTLYGEAKSIETFINTSEVKLKEDSIVTIARFQPAAKNLRKLIMYITSLKVIERMGDLLKANIDIIKDISQKTPQLIPILKDNIYKIATKVFKLLDIYISAFHSKNIEELYNILSSDDDIDISANNDYKTYLTKMKETSDNIYGGFLLILLEKKYERLSDHILHLTEDLIYILNGENIRKQELHFHEQ